MSDFPIALQGDRVIAVVIGGGNVATRKALSLLDAGAHVTVVAPKVSDEIASHEKLGRLRIMREDYNASHISTATLIVAATDSRETNAQVAIDANRTGKLVNIADAPDEGNFRTMALHRSGDLTIAVSSGGVPGAAARIRDAIAARFDGRYGRAVATLRDLRTRLLTSNGDRWKSAAAQLIGEDFCASVEDGSLDAKVASWR